MTTPDPLPDTDARLDAARIKTDPGYVVDSFEMTARLTALESEDPDLCSRLLSSPRAVFPAETYPRLWDIATEVPGGCRLLRPVQDWIEANVA